MDKHRKLLSEYNRGSAMDCFMCKKDSSLGTGVDICQKPENYRYQKFEREFMPSEIATSVSEVELTV